MPDQHGKFVGHGWSRTYEDAHERIFRAKLETENADAGLPCRTCGDYRVAHPGRVFCVPTKPSPEVEHLADRTAAEADGWSPADYDQMRSAWRTCD